MDTFTKVVDVDVDDVDVDDVDDDVDDVDDDVDQDDDQTLASSFAHSTLQWLSGN